MNKSRYVVEAAAAGGQCLLYNVANGAFVELGEQARAAWSEGALEEGPLAEQLAGLGFLTSLDAQGELACQQAAFDEARADTSALTLEESVAEMKRLALRAIRIQNLDEKSPWYGAFPQDEGATAAKAATSPGCAYITG